MGPAPDPVGPTPTPVGPASGPTASAPAPVRSASAPTAPAPAPAAGSAGAAVAGPGGPASVRETAGPGAAEYGTGAPGAVAPGAEPGPAAPVARAEVEPTDVGTATDAPAAIGRVSVPPVRPHSPAAASAGRRVGADGGPPAADPPPGPEQAPRTPEETPDDAGDGVFKVRLANFEGPFDLLLQLISKHKMDVTEVALSKVTDEFMAHIRAMGPDWDLDQTTEFLVVAATLLDLKAARLLPAAEVEDEADLALLEARDLLFARLLQYRAYKQIADIFNQRLEAEARRYPRTVGLEPHHAELLPEVVISIGPEGFAKLAVKAMQPRPKPQVYVEHIHAPLVSVQEQAGIVVARLKELGEASFRVLVRDTEDTLTVVARFLALLELYREKAVELDQETALGDLLVRWTGGDGQTQPVVTDEFDRPPEAPKEEQKA
ncbi:ScpA family protein [Streptomyces sp. CS113]|uniref:segregation and condensation protein A n=1 Tax=Streptomyces sp. CS113 TaxID=1982761 RepID=UPI00211AF4C8|nr:segregation/condensation protein A [Streptomyces sp. CS113]